MGRFISAHAFLIYELLDVFALFCDMEFNERASCPPFFTVYV
jgi:hypothetical protein